MTAAPQHFLKLNAVNSETVHAIIARAIAWKQKPPASLARLCKDRRGMVFQHPSTRTRLSFDIAIKSMGGDSVILDAATSQMQRGEPLSDTMRILNHYVDAVMMRLRQHDELECAQKVATVPLINGLTDLHHPCQVMADMMTITERFSSLKGLTVAWIGDGNNVARSWCDATLHHDFVLRLACPPALGLAQSIIGDAQKQGGRIELCADAQSAAANAHVIMTDTWVSMNHEESSPRHQSLMPYQVTEDLMSLAHKDAIFLHCLPAHRGEEVTAAVLDGAQSLAWEAANNRLHVQKAILAWCWKLL